MARAKIKYFLGVDVGNGYTKTKGIKFESRVRKASSMGIGKRQGIFPVTMNGVNYIVGQGKHFTQYGRHLTDNYKVCLLTAIANTFPNEEVINIDVTVGLPPREYMNEESTLVEDIMDSLSIKEGFDFSIQGRKHKIFIENVTVYPEGMYPIYAGLDGNILGIDMGMGTINITHFNEMDIEFSTTLPTAMHKLYLKLQSEVNSKYTGAEVSIDTIIKYFNEDKISVNQELKDATFLKPLIRDYIYEMYGEIDDLIEISDMEEVYIQGGGGIATLEYWKEFIPKIKLVPNAQEINSHIYNYIAEVEFNGQ